MLAGKIKILGKEEGYIVVEVGSDKYHFTAPYKNNEKVKK